jgi:hypothetical protein
MSLTDAHADITVHRTPHDLAAMQRDDAARGLASDPKVLSPTWLYDDLGCVLFDEITAPSTSPRPQPNRRSPRSRRSTPSFKPKDGPPPPSDPSAGRNAEVAWHGQKRSNDTHASTTDPEARLYRKSPNTAATLCYSGHLLMENRNASSSTPS